MNTRQIRESIVAELRANVTLSGLLGRVPGIPGDVPAMFQGTVTTAPPVYPSITYRLPDYSADSRFRPTPAEGGGESPINDQVLELEIWVREGHDEVGDIGDQVVATLEGNDGMTLTAGRIYQAELTTRINDQYHSDLELYFALLRFRLRLFTP